MPWADCRYAEALSDFSQAITIDPKDPLSFNARALLLERLGRADQAISDHHTASSLSPNNLSFLRSRGTCHRTLGNYDAAIKDFTRWVVTFISYWITS